MSSGASRTVPLASLEPAAPATATGRPLPQPPPAPTRLVPPQLAARLLRQEKRRCTQGWRGRRHAWTRLQPALRWQPQEPHLRRHEQARGAPAMVGPETRERPRSSAWCSRQTESPSVRTRGTRRRVRQVLRWAEVACWRHQASRHRSDIGHRQDSSGGYEHVLMLEGRLAFFSCPLGDGRDRTWSALPRQSPEHRKGPSGGNRTKSAEQGAARLGSLLAPI